MSTQLEPTWVARVEDWWNKLLGPTLSGVFERIRKQAGTSGLLEATYGETVRRFEAELSELQADVADFEAAAGQTEWAPYAARARQVAQRINGQWTDPSATKKGGVAGVFSPVATVMRTVNVSVTAIGVAWAVASIAEVHHARKLLARWSEELENGVHPSRRDRRQAHLEGVDEFGRRGKFGRRIRRYVRNGFRKKPRRPASHYINQRPPTEVHRPPQSEFGIDPEAIYDNEVVYGGVDDVTLPEGLWGDSVLDDGIVYADLGTEELAV